MRVERTASLNDDPELINVLAELAKSSIEIEARPEA